MAEEQLGLLGTLLAKLGNAPQSLLFNAGVRGLAQPTVSRYKRGPFEHFGTAWSEGSELTSRAQEAAAQNDLRREQLAQAQQEQAGMQNLQKWIGENPDATDDDIMRASMQYMPELALKARLQNVMSPADRAQLLNTQATLLELQQKVKGSAADVTTPAGATARSIETLADTFDAAEKGDNPFAPGRMFYKEAPLGKLGLTADAVLGMPDGVLRQWGDPATIRRQAEAAQLIDKETASMSQNLASLASRGTGRSATAIDNLNTSLGEGNVSITVRRKVIASTLDTIIADLEAQGYPVEPKWYALQDRLKGQTKDVGKDQGSAGEATQGWSPQGVTRQPPPDTAITPQPGVPERTPPPAEPPVAPEAAAPGALQQGWDAVTGFLNPARPAPQPSRVAPPETATGSRRSTGTVKLDAQGVPTFNRFADLERAEKNGWLRGFKSVKVGGKVYDWVPE